MASLRDVHTRGRCHVLVDDRDDAIGHALDGQGVDEVQRTRERLDRSCRRMTAELHRAARKRIGIEMADDQVGIRDGRLVTAALITSGPGLRSGAAGTDLEQVQAVETRDASAPRPDLDQLHGGDIDRHSAARGKPPLATGFELVGDQRRIVLDDAELRGGSPHVEGQHIRHARALGEIGGRDRAGGRAGLEQLDREAARLADVRETAVRQHHQQRRADAERFELGLQAGEVAIRQGSHIGIGGRGGRPLEFADLRRDLARDRDVKPGEMLLQQVARASLVRRVGIGVQEDDRDRLDALRRQCAARRNDVILVERRILAAVGAHALRGLETELAWNERLRHFDEQVVEIVFEFTPQLQRIAESRRRDEARFRAAPFDQGIGEQGRGVDHTGDALRRNTLALEQDPDAADRAFGRLERRRQLLVAADASVVLAVKHDVREGPADIDAQRQTACGHDTYPATRSRSMSSGERALRSP